MKLLLAAGALALLAVGCSKKPANLTSPFGDARGLAPLVGHSASGRVVPGSYMVVFKPGTGPVDGMVDDLCARHGFAARFRYRTAVRGFAGMLTPAALTQLRSDPRVAYVEEDQQVHAEVTQSGATWGIDRIDQADLPLSTTYTYSQTGSGVDAYIIDTGIRFSHLEFGGRAVTGIDEVTPGGTAADQNGHGTHVSGTVGGATLGVAKNVRLIAVRVLDAAGSGTFAGVTAGVDWVTADHTTRPAVANMSLGGGLSLTLDAAVRNSIADGVVYCVAAGNSAINVTQHSPADVAEAITVAASSITDAFATFSNFGAGVDLIAPGVSITSAWFSADNATNTISGTSMATPHVAGAAALYLESNPAATPAEVVSALTASASANRITLVPAGTPNRLLFTTLGSAPPPPPPPPPPTGPSVPTLVSPADGATGLDRSPTMTWNAATGATSYHVQVSSSSSFTSTAFDQAGITGTSVQSSRLVRGNTYFWHVNASNTGGTSAYSSTRQFTIRR